MGALPPFSQDRTGPYTLSKSRRHQTLRMMRIRRAAAVRADAATHATAAAGLGLVGEREQQLGEAALGRGVVAQHGREGRVAEGFRKALAQGFTRAGVVGEAVCEECRC